MEKRDKIFFALLTLLIVTVIYSMPLASAASICCEKTLNGAICQDTTSENCAEDATQAPTSCSQTSFCKMGTCIDTNAGECKPNTPQRACEEISGIWDGREVEEISQCKQGCCFLGERTLFSTNTECKTLSGLYGLKTVFDGGITNPLECIASGASEDKGACVYEDEDEFGNACDFTTEKKCQEKKTSSSDLNVQFFKDYLCTAEELNTNCAPDLKKTSCNEERVYFMDTCGNLANIYDASKINPINQEYWTKIIKPEDSCGYGNSNANSPLCGSCSFNLGSTCSEVKRGETATPRIGNYICRDLSCEYEDEDYQHGEKWCATTPGTSVIGESKEATPNSFDENVPGSEYVVLSCRNGKVDYEQCAGMRRDVCIENTIYPDDVTPFRNAKCSPNLWDSCISMSNKEDCEDIEKRDCKWVPTLSRTDDDRLTTWVPRIEGDVAPLIRIDDDLPKAKGGFSSSQILSLIAEGGFGAINLNNYHLGKTSEQDADSNFQNGACVPRYAPGFDFMEKVNGTSAETRKKITQSAADICSLASARCVIKKDKSFLEGGDWESAENSECEPDPNGPYLWYESMKNICVSLGDCGASVNFIGEDGDVKEDIQATFWN